MFNIKICFEQYTNMEVGLLVKVTGLLKKVG
jgi:hypothetical protein